MQADQRHIVPKRSLILAGGGIRVAYQAGVLVALEEAGIQFHHVDGTSGGIFNTAMLASGLEAKEIAQRWRSLKVKHFISGRKFKDYFKPFSMTGYADADNIRTKVFPHLGIDLHKIRSNSSFNATFNVCNFSVKTVEAISHQEVLEDHLVAGVSLPMMMPALKIGKDWYTDAVWIKDAHLMEAVRQGAEELWLVWAIGNAHKYYPGAFNQYVHMIEMSANGALLEEFYQINLINQMIDAGQRNGLQKKPISLFVIKSPDPLPLDPDLFFNKINTRELINMGYAHSKSYFANSPNTPTPMDAQATKNGNPGTVLSFRAVFSGRQIWDDSPTKVIYYTFFRFSRGNEKPLLSFYSSIFLSHLDQEIIAHSHNIHGVKNGHCLRLTVTSKLLIQGEEHTISAAFNLRSPVDFLIGLEMKRCHISITDKDSLRLEGDLHQSLSHRLRSCFLSQVRKDGKAAGLKTRLDMISKLLEYEV
jgi:predicted acylesterase/phospholipase RssA